jgi:hypothetical protein
VSIGFIAFVCLGLYLLIAIGPLEVTSQSIVHNTPLAKYRIGWDVVRRIEIDPAGVGLVFIGEDKQLIVAGPGYWSAADRARMLSLLQLEVERRQIEVAQTKKAMWRLQRNTKIRKQQGST